MSHFSFTLKSKSVVETVTVFMIPNASRKSLWQMEEMIVFESCHMRCDRASSNFRPLKKALLSKVFRNYLYFT